LLVVWLDVDGDPVAVADPVVERLTVAVVVAELPRVLVGDVDELFEGDEEVDFFTLLRVGASAWAEIDTPLQKSDALMQKLVF
jgi:hypothetical protein